MAANPLHMTKRVQVDKTKAVMLGIVVGASIISVFALVTSKSLFSQAGYLNKVAGEKDKAVKQLKANEAATATLVSSYKSFSSQDPNLIGGKSTGTGERDGDNARLILDALPSKYDFPALATSVEKLLNGYTINSITGSDDNVIQAETESSELVEMPFQVDVNTDYKGMQALLSTFEKSIRPFQVVTIKLTGTNTELQGTISSKTFYQPAKDQKVTLKVVK